LARILFADDDPFTLITLTKAVEVLGHQALSAGTGREAAHLASSQKPDLIFIDLRLPDVSGLEVVRWLSKRLEGIPIFLLSAGPEVDVVEQARQAGARGFISKPIRLQTLQELIQNHVTGGKPKVVVSVSS
jgi:CheY-like chemotaxis protein